MSALNQNCDLNQSCCDEAKIEYTEPITQNIECRALVCNLHGMQHTELEVHALYMLWQGNACMCNARYACMCSEGHEKQGMYVQCKVCMRNARYANHEDNHKDEDVIQVWSACCWWLGGWIVWRWWVFGRLGG